MEDYSIEALGRMLNSKGMELETAINVSLQLRKGDKRKRLMQWVEANPVVTEEEIQDKALEMLKE